MNSRVTTPVALLLLCLGSGCSTSSPCPQGMKVVAEKSRPPLLLWCETAAEGTKKARRIEFFEGGRKKQECRFAAGVPEGKFTAWHQKAGVWLEGNYEAGQKTGKWTQHNDSGSMVAEGEYRFGNLIAGAPVGAPAACERTK